MKTLTLYRPKTKEGLGSFNGFDRYLDSFFGNDFFGPGESIFTRALNHKLPNIDLRETEQNFILEAELPGYSEKEIEVHLENNVLSIASAKEDEKEEKEEKTDGSYLVRECHRSSFSRAIRLPQRADPESIKASFKNGILQIEIAKKAEAAKKLINITSG